MSDPREGYPGQFAKWDPRSAFQPTMVDVAVISAMASAEVRLLLARQGQLNTAAASIMATTYIMENMG